MTPAPREGSVVLVDGRRIAYCDAGPPDGVPVLLTHGSPGSRHFVPPATPEHVRLVTFDRPGYGGSDPNPGRTVRATAADGVAVLDHLGIDRVAVVGWSGGCPTAAALLVELGATRVSGAALVSGPGPIDEVPDAWDLLGERRRPSAELARAGEIDRARRRILRTMEPFIGEPVAFLGAGGRSADGQLVADPQYRPMLVEQITEGLRPGAEGVADDLLAMWLPFGFALADVPVPVTAFHGALDRDNGADLRTYAERVPGSSLRVWDDLGHFGILVRWHEVLDAVGVAPAAQGGHGVASE